MTKVVLSVLLLALLGGCASEAPLLIREPLVDSPSLAEVQRNPEAFANRRVRWGGVIVSTKSVADRSEVEVLAKALQSDGRPQPGDVSLGRFLIDSDEFLDPALYGADREVSVYGVIENVLVRNIGEHPYAYPLVQATQLYLWAERGGYRDSRWFPMFHFGLGFGFGL